MKKKSHTKLINSKEKELALSLLRIPMNFFEERKDKPSNERISSKNKPNLDSKNKTGDLSLSGEIDVDFTASGQLSGSAEIQPSKNSSETPDNSNKKETTNNKTSDTLPDTSKTSNQPQKDDNSSSDSKNTTTPDSNETSKDESDKNSNADNNLENESTEDSSQVNNSENKSNKPSDKEDSDKDVDMPDNKEKENNQNSDNRENNSNQNSNQSPNESKNQEKNANQDSKKTSNESSEGPAPSNTPEPNDNDKNLDRLQDKFGKTPAGEKLNGLKDKFAETPVGEKLNDFKDKINSNPAANGALNALGAARDAKKTIDNAKDAINNMDGEKVAESAGDMAVKAAGHAGDLITPGLGKGIQAADKVLGNTSIGKFTKKSVGCCCIAGCMVPIILMLFVLLPIFFVTEAFSWATDLFSRDESIYGELTEEDAALIAEASTFYSMQNYTDFTTELNNPTFLASFFGTDSDYPIQDGIEKFLTEHYTYTADDVKEFDDKYSHLVENGYLMPIAEGDSTSFGMAFDLLADNYTVTNLKAPSSAPKRTKTLPNGDEVTYTTYDPTGIHQALFEDVLNNMDELKTRFEDQVSPKWFDELDELLDKKFNVYVEGIDDPALVNDKSSLPERSLRDLFAETSTKTNDTEYYVTLVQDVFTKNYAINSEITVQYRELVKRLSMLELMTYMLSYQKHYTQIEDLRTNSLFKGNYANATMFDDEFFGQFLTFSNVEYYLALSSLADHSLTYEIAVASIDASTDDSIQISTFTLGNKKLVAIELYTNWYATYNLNPSIIPCGAYNFYYQMDPVVEETQIRKYLFDKYNVESNPSYIGEERSPEENQSAFFSLFEQATGIKMSQIDEYGNVQTPTYELDENGMMNNRVFNAAGTGATGILQPGKAFPVVKKGKVTVTGEFMSAYDDDLAAKAGHKWHNGIDYGISEGTQIVACAPGTAYTYRGNTGFGNYVKIVHDDGFTSYYGHGNGKFFVNSGQRVEAGQPIMESGNSGLSTGPHLHFEVRITGTSPIQRINPNYYIYQQF